MERSASNGSSRSSGEPERDQKKERSPLETERTREARERRDERREDARNARALLENEEDRSYVIWDEGRENRRAKGGQSECSCSIREAGQGQKMREKRGERGGHARGVSSLGLASTPLLPRDDREAADRNTCPLRWHARKIFWGRRNMPAKTMYEINRSLNRLDCESRVIKIVSRLPAHDRSVSCIRRFQYNVWWIQQFSNRLRSLEKLIQLIRTFI